MFKDSFLTQDETEKVRLAILNAGLDLHEMKFVCIAKGSPCLDNPMRNSGAFRLSYNGICREYQAKVTGRDHVNAILGDIQSGFFSNN